MSEKEFADKAALFSLYLMDGFRSKAVANGQPIRILSFSISITNTASVSNSIMRVELHVECLGKEGKSVKYIIPHDSLLSKEIQGRDITPFECPKLFEPKESQSRWVLFAESPMIPDDVRRDSYSIVVTDALGATVQTNALIIKDLSI